MAQMSSNWGAPLVAGMQALSLVPNTGDQASRGGRGGRGRGGRGRGRGQGQGQGRGGSNQDPTAIAGPSSTPYVAHTLAPPSFANIQAQQIQEQDSHNSYQAEYHWPILNQAGQQEYCVQLPRGIRPFITSPGSNAREYIAQVEKEFNCGVQWSNSKVSDRLIDMWVQPLVRGAPVTSALSNGSLFLEGYRKEISAARVAGEKGPRIDIFLRAYMAYLAAQGSTSGPSTIAPGQASSNTPAPASVTSSTTPGITIGSDTAVSQPVAAATDPRNAPAQSTPVKDTSESQASTAAGQSQTPATDRIMRQEDPSLIHRDRKGEPVLVSAAETGSFAKATKLNSVILDKAAEEKRRRTVIDEVTAKEVLFEDYLPARDERVVLAAKKLWLKELEATKPATQPEVTQAESTTKDTPAVDLKGKGKEKMVEEKMVEEKMVEEVEVVETK